MFDFAFNAQRFAVYLIPTLLGIIMHEVAHGWMASRKGDQTARFMGRLTLNPVSHFDALGAAVFLLTSLGTGFIFGWAKPVPVNVRNLRDPARDMMWVALAGPVTNFLLAIGFALVLGAVVAMLPSPDISDTTRYFLLMLVAGVNINLCLLDQPAAHPAAGRQQDRGLFPAAARGLGLYERRALRLHHPGAPAGHGPVGAHPRASYRRGQRSAAFACRYQVSNGTSKGILK